MSSSVVFPKSKMTSSQSGPITIDNLQVGPIEIQNVNLTNFVGKFKYQSGTMKNMRMRFRITPYIKWSIGIYIDLPWPFDDIYIGDSGEHTFETVNTQLFSLGDVAINGGDLNFTIENATLGPFRIAGTTVKGESNVQAVHIEDVRMLKTKIPTGLPSVLGADIEFPNPSKPMNISVVETDMARFSSDGVTLPNMHFSGIQALNVNIGQATSGNISVTTENAVDIQAGSVTLIDIATITLGFKVKADMYADGMVFGNLNGEVKTDSASSSGFTMNLGMSGLVMCHLKLAGFSAPTVKYEG